MYLKNSRLTGRQIDESLCLKLSSPFSPLAQEPENKEKDKENKL
jgi:hypothetical protein